MAPDFSVSRRSHRLSFPSPERPAHARFPHLDRPLLRLGARCRVRRAPAPPASAAEPPLLGFTARSRRPRERTLEERFDAALHRADIRDWVERLSKRPHHVGSPYGKENAEWMAGLFRSWGYDTRIETFDVLFPTPKACARSRCSRRARSRPRSPSRRCAEDATSGQAAEQLPTYNAYSIDGDVTGELVYVNYGVPEDYEELERRGIDVKGKIVIARYGALVARDQAEGRRRARRGRLPHLLRPARRRLLPGRRLPEGRLPSRRGRAARLGGRHAALPRRPADAGRRRDCGRQAAAARAARRRSRRSRCCRSRTRDARPLLEALAGPGGARGLARRAADHVPPRAGARPRST